jgi:hypothetical protein
MAPDQEPWWKVPLIIALVCGGTLAAAVALWGVFLLLVTVLETS